MKINSTFPCYLFAFLITLTNALPTTLYSAEQLTLVGSRDTKESMHGRWLLLIYGELFQRIGLDWSYEAYSSARASVLSDSGEADGEINRVSGYNNTHPNLTRVNEPHFPTRLVAYAIQPGIILDGWSSLENSSYRVEYRRGTKIVRDGLTSIIAPTHLSTVVTAQQGLKKLISNRSDIYIDVEDLVIEVLLKLDNEKFDSSQVYNAGTMAEDSLHMFLHKNRATLIPKITQTLKDLKNEGLVELYRKSVMQTNQHNE